MGLNDVNELPFLSAGFRSPAEEYSENRLDFNSYFRKNRPSAVKEFRIQGMCMEGAHIPPKSIVIVDLFLNKPKNGSIVAAVVDGEKVIKQLVTTSEGDFLISAPVDGRQESIRIGNDMNVKILGTVTHVIIDLYYSNEPDDSAH
jgi:DNA polymerase V